MDNAHLLETFDREVRRDADWTRMRREVLPNLVRHVPEGAVVGGGYITWSQLAADNADAEIEAQVAYFSTLKSDFEWKYYSHDQPADLAQRLLAYGFKAGKPEALMVAEIDTLPDDYWRRDASSVKPVKTAEDIDAIIEMENEVWGKDLSDIGIGMKYDLEHHPDLLSIFGVWQNGCLVSAAWTQYLKSTSFASFWGGTTLNDYRNRGYYTSLLAARAREAKSRGYKFLTVDASRDSRPILEKNGFACLGFSTPYEWSFQ